MPLWIYMGTVFLSLPKQIIFVVLGTPSSENSKAAKYAKIIAIIFLVFITSKYFPNIVVLFSTVLIWTLKVLASRWIRPRIRQATQEIEVERGIVHEEGY
jgi:hypothetical protein